MWVKICGNTNLEDAQLAAELGSDALGFVFAESKRQVTAAQVARITPHLPAHVERVGVFYSRDAKEIASIVREAGLNAAQLHGGVDLELTAKLREILDDAFGLVQTLHWTIGTDSSAALGQQLRQIELAGTVNRVLIDSRVGQAGGGTGISFDWKAARSVIAENAGGLKVIVAGGLRPDNVGEAVRELSPWGVEASAGRKDPQKLEEFLRIARVTQ
jgi:phosphoribosylanthranilate isomerase